MHSTPTPERVRLTISVTPEVHDTFKRIAAAGSMSIGRAMGDWLGDTIEGAEFIASKMEQARAAPKVVMREMHSYALGLADETGALMEQLREKGRADRAKGQRSRDRAPGPDGLSPPVCNTGGKVPGRGKGGRS